MPPKSHLPPSRYAPEVQLRPRDAPVATEGGARGSATVPRLTVRSSTIPPRGIAMPPRMGIMPPKTSHLLYIELALPHQKIRGGATFTMGDGN